MATFIENLRTSGLLPTRGDIQKARRTRKAAQGSVDASDNQQTNQPDRAGLLDDKDYIVQNTFKMGRDGVNYGIGRDGRTYSYTVDFNNNVSEPRLLSAEEQRDVINGLTNGKIEISPDITNQESLTSILRSVNRMFEKGGNLVPDKVEIANMYPTGTFVLGGAQGQALRAGFGTSPNDVIWLNNLDSPSYNKLSEQYNYKKGWHSSGKFPGEHVPTHELSHTADFATSRLEGKWRQERQREVQENADKYPVSEFLKKAISNFYGMDYEPKYRNSVGAQLEDEMDDKYSKWLEEDEKNGLENNTSKFFEIAAEEAGFDSVEDAAASISAYAGHTYPDIFKINGQTYRYDSVKKPEVFAEAYTDVLINGDDAADFSKRLIKLWSDYADRWSDRTGVTRDKRAQEFKQMFDVLPDFKTNSGKKALNPFIQNYRSAPWRYEQ